MEMHRSVSLAPKLIALSKTAKNEKFWKLKSSMRTSFVQTPEGPLSLNSR